MTTALVFGLLLVSNAAWAQDADSDTWPDAVETALGTDPNNSASVPPSGVRSASKISDTAGGFSGSAGAGALEAQDLFGSAVGWLGDLDGDGVEDVAVGAFGTSGGTVSGTGAVWLLFLNPDFSVKSSQKIPAPAGLEAGDRFGRALAVGTRSPGMLELAVGAPGDDDGATSAGAVWLYTLVAASPPATPQVTFSRKISQSSTDFVEAGGSLDPSDRFGEAVDLGDVDGDGVLDLLVGVPGDDDTGPCSSQCGGTGGVWVLFRNSWSDHQGAENQRYPGRARRRTGRLEWKHPVG